MQFLQRKYEVFNFFRQKTYAIDILQYGRGSNIKQDKQIRHVQPLVFCIYFSPFGSLRVCFAFSQHVFVDGFSWVGL